MVAYLCSEESSFTGGIFTAGGGHDARAAMVESPGVTLGIDAIPSVEQIADSFGKIADLIAERATRRMRRELRLAGV